MNRVWHKPAVLLMWLALPTAAWIYWRVWDQLPAAHGGALRCELAAQRLHLATKERRNWASRFCWSCWCCLP